MPLGFGRGDTTVAMFAYFSYELPFLTQP